MNPTELLNQLIAKIQGEVGRFLILKEKIMSLPAGDKRDTLLVRQNSLEGRALSLMSDANALKESTKAQGLNILKLFSGDTINKVKTIASSGTALLKEMQAHTTEVNSAAGIYASPANSAAGGGSFAIHPVLRQVLVIAGAAFAVNYAWREARRRVGA